MSDKKDAGKPKKEEDDDLNEKPSYTYWKRESDIQADHKGFQPEKIKPNNEQNNSNNNNVGSVWNKAGTWEEKKITKKNLEEFFNNYIEKNKKIYKNSFSFENFSDFNGDVRILFNDIKQCYYVFSRGKIKYFYDCEIKLKIKGENNCKGNTTITIKNMNNEDEDEHFEYEFDDNDKDITKLFKSEKNLIENDIRNIFNEMKDYYLK